MSSPTRKRRERADENTEDCDPATQPSPRWQRTDGSGDNADSERSLSSTSRLWQVLHDPSAFEDDDDIDFQPKAFLALIDDVFRNSRDEVEYRVRLAARSILSSRTLDSLFKRVFDSVRSDASKKNYVIGGENDGPVHELCLIQRIDSLRSDMSRVEKDGPVEGLRLIDRIVSRILFLMWNPGKDWSVDELCLIERIVAFIVDEIIGEDQVNFVDCFCLIKQMVPFIGEIIGEKDDQIDKLHLINQIGLFIGYGMAFGVQDFSHGLGIMAQIAEHLYEGVIYKKGDPVYGLNLIDRFASFFLDVNRAKEDGQVDKLCLIERIVSFIDDIIGEKDGQVDKLHQIEQIFILFVDINELVENDVVDELRLMWQIVTLLGADQVDKLHLIKQIISILKDDNTLGVDKLEMINSWTVRKLLGHGSSRSVYEELEARNREIELLIEAPTQDTVRDTLKGYKGRSKYMQYFTRQEGNKWLCNLCGKDDPLERKILERNKDGTTTPFLRHLEKFHIKEYNKIRDAEK